MAQVKTLSKCSIATAARILAHNLATAYTPDEVDYFVDLLLIQLDEVEGEKTRRN